MTTDANLTAARESFWGKSMTETQLKEAVAIADIIHGEILRSGSFKDKLTDYAHAFAREERFDAIRGEQIIRDIYSAVQGRTMWQTLEGLNAAKETLPDHARTRALDCAEGIEPAIQDGATMPFYQAYDRAAVSLSTEFGITQGAAKTLMKDTFKDRYASDLVKHGKDIEEAYHKPVLEAEIAARKAEKLQTQSHSRSYS